MYEEELNDDGIDIRHYFEREGILMDNLMERGELAITDSDLEKCGMNLAGLIAIPSVIRSNQ